MFACVLIAPRCDASSAEIDDLSERVDELSSQVTRMGFQQHEYRINGYVDLGFVVPGGDGVGFRPDTGNSQRSRFPGVPWILLGDPWSTPVNSRGEPADTDGSFAIPFDSIDSEGRATFLVNELNLDFWAPLPHRASLNASVDFLPRTGAGGRLGDSVDVDFAYLEHRPWEGRDWILQVGKFRSAFGLEYRRQESTDRIGITPSLIHRYVGGHPLGIKLRGRFADRGTSHGIANLSYTNGNSRIEEFPFAEEIDSNNGKTTTLRLGWVTEGTSWADFLEIGVSGQLGSQSRQPDDQVVEHQVGADLAIRRGDFEMRMEWLEGRSPGTGTLGAPLLDFEGGYIQMSYAATNVLTPYLRWGFRDAIHLGDTFVYVVDISRLTVGVRVEVGPRWLVKAEYLDNEEHGPVPDIENDLLVISNVMSF